MIKEPYVNGRHYRVDLGVRLPPTTACPNSWRDDAPGDAGIDRCLTLAVGRGVCNGSLIRFAVHWRGFCHSYLPFN